MAVAGLRDYYEYSAWFKRPVDVKIGYAATSLGYAAFYGCYRLERITIPETVVSIGEDAFNSCTSI